MTLVDKTVNNYIEQNVSSDAAVTTRRRRAPEAARDNILAAAEAMLIATGPQALKLADVARAAGVSNASVLHHFGSIDGVQTALMERMIRQLVDRILAATSPAAGPLDTAAQSVVAIFDAFETRGAARLAAWLELTGEARRLTLVREAVREVIAVRVQQYPGVSPDDLEDFTLACIVTALGVGLFGHTLGALLGKPDGRAREVALSLLLERLGRAGSAGDRVHALGADNPDPP
jgi:AcrR family transcriptional regulator